MSEWDLGTLADPAHFQGPIDTAACEAGAGFEHLEKMLRIRLVERKLADGKRDGVIGGPVHLGVGQDLV